MTTTPEARPRGTRLPRLARRRQLLGAAQEVFVAQGYHAAAMDEIAERAGVSKPVLYQHFPGKLELYLALLDEHAEALVQTVREALESTTDNKTRVQASMAAFYDFVAGEGEAFRLVFESDLRNVAPVRARLERANHQCAEMIARAPVIRGLRRRSPWPRSAPDTGCPRGRPSRRITLGRSSPGSRGAGSAASR